MFAARLFSLILASAALVAGGAGPLATAQTPTSDGSKKALPTCKGTSRATWNNCAGNYTSTDGAFYVGEFRAGKYDGNGSATWPNGDRYVGEFLNDKFHGQGVYTGEKSFVYVGEFREGKFNGLGTYTSSSGMKYVGEWRDDEKHGQGTYTWPSGRVYIGQFREDERDGQGSETMPDGTKYVGEFRESKRWGAGTLYDASGKPIQSGMWREDRFDPSSAMPAPTLMAAAAPAAAAPVSTPASVVTAVSAPASASAPTPSVSASPAASTPTSITSEPTVASPAMVAGSRTSSSATAVTETPPSGATPTSVTTPSSVVAQSPVAAQSSVATPAPAPAVSQPAAISVSSADSASAQLAAIPRPSTDGRARVALVIGNQTYTTVPSLRNARADAEAMAAALDTLGFEVILRLDLDDRALRQAMRDFKSRLDGGSEAVFYFAGHGVQLGAANYLLPTNISPESEEQVKDDALMLQRVLDDLSEQKVRFSVAIVDACRDNPFPKTGTRSLGSTRGLAPTTAATGQMILFSAGAGQTALDNLSPDDSNPNGVFTRVLLREMTRPGVPVDQVLKRTRQEVVSLAKSIGHEQVPALYDQTVGEFFFMPAIAGPQMARPVEVAAPAAFASMPTDDRALWESVRDSKNPEEIQAYLNQFPQGLFAGVANVRLRALMGGGPATPTSIAPSATRPASAGTGGATITAAAGAAIATNAAILVPASGQSIGDLQKLAAGAVFKDCADCPEMVVIPSGKFEMGLADFRKVRRPTEGPAREVSIPGTFAIGKTEVTWSEYARFVRETSRTGGMGCDTYNAKRFRTNAQAAWNSPGFPQTENDPVVCVSWDDAKAYAEWLGVKTGHNYRLITEAEWEYVVRAGTKSERFWGENPADACRFGNVADATGRGSLGLESVFDCRDRFAGTAPAASFQSNPFGVHDLFGNAEEWLLDCWSDTYRNAPNSGIANTSGDCDRRVVRGGSWFDGAETIRATARAADEKTARTSTRGFRIARTN
jgi:formylglycine-generating enzyme required for sulfatase activity